MHTYAQRDVDDTRVPIGLLMRELMHSLRRTNPSPCTQHEVYETPVADRTIIMRDPNLVWVGRVLILRTNGLHSMARSCGVLL